MIKFADIFTALAKAQAGFPIIPRDKTVEVTMKSGGKYKFAYAPLDTIISAVRTPLSDNGLSFMQTVVDEKVITVLNHASGVSLRLAPTKIICNESGPQAYGSALTYARRYSLTLALGIVADEDDDANGAGGNTAKDLKKDLGKKRDQPPQPPPQPKAPTLSPDQDKYFPRIKAALDTLHGTDTATKKAVIKEFTTFEGEDGAEVPGVDDYRKLDGKRLQVLCHKLEAVVKKGTDNA